MNVDRMNESRVLGGLMELGDEALFALSWDVKYFADSQMMTVMQLILDQVESGQPYDRMTIHVRAQQKFKNPELNIAILSCWEDKAFGLVDLGFWHQLLLERWQVREIELQAKRILENPDVMAEAVQAIADANSVVESVDVLNTIREDFDEHIRTREEGVALIPSGEPSIDRLLGGGWRAGMYGIAGRPKQGKSMVMLHLARKLAEQDCKVLFVSYEMDEHQVYDRYLASILGIDSNLIAKNDLTDFERQEVRNAKDSLPDNLVVVSSPDRDVSDLYKLIERTRKKLGGLDAVFVDYAQIMTVPNHRGNDAEKHAALSTRLQQMTMRVNLPVITGLQLRKPETVNEKKVPGTSDIAGSDKYARDVVGIFYIIRSLMEGDDPFGIGSEIILKFGTSRFTAGGSTRFIAEDKFSRIVHKEWR
jgi:replicative DNA helicase